MVEPLLTLWLHLHVWKGIMTNLVLNGMDDINPRSNQGVTPLHDAARNGHFNTFKYIIDSIEDKNPRTNLGHKKDELH